MNFIAYIKHVDSIVISLIKCYLQIHHDCEEHSSYRSCTLLVETRNWKFWLRILLTLIFFEHFSHFSWNFEVLVETKDLSIEWPRLKATHTHTNALHRNHNHLVKWQLFIRPLWSDLSFCICPYKIPRLHTRFETKWHTRTFIYDERTYNETATKCIFRTVHHFRLGRFKMNRNHNPFSLVLA